MSWVAASWDVPFEQHWGAYGSFCHAVDVAPQLYSAANPLGSKYSWTTVGVRGGGGGSHSIVFLPSNIILDTKAFQPRYQQK